MHPLRPVISSVQKQSTLKRAVPREAKFAVADGFVTTIWRKPGEVTREVERVVLVLEGEMKRAGIQEALGLRHEDSYGLCIWPVPQICPEYSNSRNKNGLACASKHNLAVFPPCLLGGGLFRNAWQTIMLPVTGIHGHKFAEYYFLVQAHMAWRSTG